MTTGMTTSLVNCLSNLMPLSTAAVKYKNGTTIIIPMVDDSPEYVAAMRTMAEDFRHASKGQPAVL